MEAPEVMWQGALTRWLHLPLGGPLLFRPVSAATVEEINLVLTRVYVCAQCTFCVDWVLFGARE